MRKDLHIGLAIGGVLLAVLIVWGVVVGRSKKHTNQVTLDKTGVTSPSGDIPAPTPASPAVATDTNVIAPPTIIATVPQAAVDAPAPSAAADKKDTDWVGLLAGSTPAPEPKKDNSLQPATAIDTRGPVVSSAQPGSQQVPVADTAITTTPLAAGSTAADSSTAVAVDAPAAPTAKTHKIERGETFASISKAVYGDSRYYDQIAQANPKINPNRLRPGTVINIPDAAEVKSSSKKTQKPAAAATSDAAAKPTATAVDTQKEYRVVAGDSLYKISMRLYGSGEEADHLYDLNKEKIGPDKSKLKQGAILKIPAPPTALARAS